jgi:hypothetical protein
VDIKRGRVNSVSAKSYIFTEGEGKSTDFDYRDSSALLGKKFAPIQLKESGKEK